MRIALAFGFLSALTLASVADAKDAKPTVEEVLARHLEAIGPAEARAAVHSRIGEGIVALRIMVGGSAQLAGRALLYSGAGTERVNLRFDDPNYYGESFNFVDGKSDTGYFQPGHRSPIGTFLAVYDDPLRERLLAGVLSANWALLDLAAGGAKLRYDGLKKVDDKPLHQVSYLPEKNRNDVKILLFFEPESFRHVRTTYSKTLTPGMSGDITQSSQQLETHYDLEETFAGFQTVEGLTLPTQWVLRFGTQSTSGTTLWRFEVAIQRFRTNPPAGEAAQD